MKTISALRRLSESTPAVAALAILAVAALACGLGKNEPASTPAAGNAPAASAPAAAAPVKVTLTWDKPVDMDLEIWDAKGENLVARSFVHCGTDVTDGTAGNEFFEFRQFGADNFSSGKFVVSVYFAARQDESIDRARATLTIKKADGSTETRERTVDYETGKDQWHAFAIDAANGGITDIDQFIQIQTSENNN